MQEFIDTQILHAWDDKDRQGWFEETVHGRNLNKADRALPLPILQCDTKSLTIGVGC